MSLKHYALLPLLFIFQLVLHSTQQSEQNSDCPFFTCGSLGKVGFPFSNTSNPKCGVIVLNCTETKPKVRFSEQGKWYHVNYIDYTVGTIGIHKKGTNPCNKLGNFSEPVSPLISIEVIETLPFFKCMCEPDLIISSSNFFNTLRNYTWCKDYVLYLNDSHKNWLPSLPEPLSTCCSVVRLPTSIFSGPDFSLPAVGDLSVNFSIKWTVVPDCWGCYNKGGQCLLSGLNRTLKCGNLKGSSPGKKVAIEGGVSSRARIGIVVSSSGVGILVMILILIRYIRKPENGILSWKKKPASTKNFEAFLKHHGSLALKRYNFKEVKTMTKSFKNKLGQGGYGSVFKGTLNDGKFVAVKVLSETKGDGEEFVNEVASISRTSHVNIVSLLGYCFDGSKRALIYEFMPNGSLEKYIYNQKPSEANSHLGWGTLYQITVGIARGLEYLHRGCNTRILHFDIKPHNILLDQDFCPKISDFGLAKLCPRKESIISMLGARGTAGYIAPEVFSRNFGGVSHKSDVYSYGMMILEMVGGRKNIDVGVCHTSEIYFPSWIYKRIELDEDLGLYGVISKVEGEITRKMILVGLWCIQTNPLDRPSMSRVLEMLESSLEVLTIPPKPYLSSPPRVPESSSIN